MTSWPTATGRGATAGLVPAPAGAGGDVDARASTTLRLLAADAVQAAGSGHPGLPMGAASMAWVLWSRFLRHDPACPDWPDRDRFVLSAGHGSMLLYGLLHLFGYPVSLDDLRAFRRLGSATPGHPEHGHTPGVEMTTGPLGQGLGAAVGMALAERLLAARFNTADAEVVDHRTFVLASDGDLMEGLSHEAAALAGHLRLGRLIVLYDDNRVTIDGPTGLAHTEDVGRRFAGYGWQVQQVRDGENRAAVETALCAALRDERPSLVMVRTLIGFGAPTKEGTSAAHGAPLGAEELAGVRRRFGWPDEPFHVPADVARQCARLAEAGAGLRASWEARFAAWAAAHPRLAERWGRAMRRDLPAELAARLPAFDPVGHAAVATRKASGAVLATVGDLLPELVGGSADLAGSTYTTLPGAHDVTRDDFSGRTVHFGVREHGMAAALNGMALHGGFRPYGSTFLVFADYARPAIRLAALMGQPVVYLFTHDSIGVGEDGPTHQPVEQLAALRAIPGLAVLRPADANETVEAWRVALQRSGGPTAVVLSRQDLPVLPPPPAGAVAGRGAWVVRGVGETPRVTLVATGSEVAVALAAADLLAGERLAARVVSMPWRERFLALPTAERDRLLPPGVPRVVVEAGCDLGWARIAGPAGDVVSVEKFGMCGSAAELFQVYGFTAAAVADRARAVLGVPGAQEVPCRTS